MTALPLRISYIFIFLLGTAYLVGSLQMPLGRMDMPGPGVFPLIVAVTMIGLSTVALLISFGPARKSSQETESFPRGKERRRIFAIIATIILFVSFLPFIGYGACSAGLMVASLRFLGMRNWIRILIISALTAAASAYLFSILGVPLPKGSILG
jgi:putative tricarboxylic transport membrane protein